MSVLNNKVQFGASTQALRGPEERLHDMNTQVTNAAQGTLYSIPYSVLTCIAMQKEADTISRLKGELVDAEELRAADRLMVHT